MVVGTVRRGRCHMSAKRHTGRNSQGGTAHTNELLRERERLRAEIDELRNRLERRERAFDRIDAQLHGQEPERGTGEWCWRDGLHCEAYIFEDGLAWVTSYDPTRHPLRDAILQFLVEGGNKPITPAMFQAHLDDLGMYPSPSHLSMTLSRMETAGALVRPLRGSYRLPPYHSGG
jgi:hypothetical protein